MDLWTATKVVFRRWRIVVPALILTFVVAFVVVGRVAPTYKATGTIEFLASNDGNTANPYNGFNSALQTTATLVGTSVGSQKSRYFFAKSGLDANYKIVAPYDPTRAVLVPSLDLSVESSNADVALATLKRLSAAVTLDLETRQTKGGGPRQLWIQTNVAAMDTAAIKQTGNATRVLILILLLGVAVSISLAFFAESLTSDSKSRRAVALPPGADGSGAEPPEGETAATMRLTLALEAMRAALTVAEDTTATRPEPPAVPPVALPPGPKVTNPPLAPPASASRPPTPATGAAVGENGNGKGSGNGNGKKAAPAEGIDRIGPAPRPRPEPAKSTNPSGPDAGKPGPLPVARPAPGQTSDEGDRPSSGGRPNL